MGIITLANPLLQFAFSFFIKTCSNFSLHPSLPSHGSTFILWQGIPFLEDSTSDLKLHTCEICNQHKKTHFLPRSSYQVKRFLHPSKVPANSWVLQHVISQSRNMHLVIFIETQKCINNAI